MDQLVRFETRAVGHDHALRPVPHGDAGGHAGGELRPQVIAVKPVIGHQHDRRVRTGEVDQPLQHHVVGTVGAIDDVLIHLEIRLRDARHLGRMVVHEKMADLIDRPEIDRHEIPLRIALHQVTGGRLHRVGLGQFLRQTLQAAVALLIDLRAIRHESADHLAGDVGRGDPPVVEFGRQLRRPVGAGHRLRPFGWVHLGGHAFDVAIHVGNQLAVEPLFALGGEPAHHMAAESLLAQHFPQRLALAGRGGHRDDPATHRIDLGETFHTVVIGHFAGGDGRPQHRRKLRLERREIAADAALDKPGHAGEFPCVEQRVDQFPIGGIPADEQEALFHSRGGRKWWYGWRLNRADGMPACRGLTAACCQQDPWTAGSLLPL